jgi:hypothetical protein
MQYTLTKQYARDIETPFAQFIDSNDANIFIQKRISIDETFNVKLIYSMFNNNCVSCEFNSGKINISSGRIKNEDIETVLLSYSGPFKITKKSAKLNELLVAQFSDLYNARIFVEAICSHNTLNNHDSVYSIFNDDIFLEEWNQEKSGLIKEQTQTSQGQARSITFRPTPFNTSPRPPGSPPPWIKDADDGDNKDEH